MNNGSHHKQVIYPLLMVLIISGAVFAQRYRDNNMGRETRASEKDLRKEEMRQEAVKSFPAISDALRTILESVSKNQRPPDEAVGKARQLLEENKRNGWAYDEMQRGQYMLLQAWTNFYEGKPKEALSWSMKAAKTDVTNGDAWISQSLFCMLNGRRPMMPKKSRSQSQSDPVRDDRSRRSRPLNIDDMPLPETNGMPNQSYGSKRGVLEFDISLLRSDILKKRFSRSEYHGVDNSTIEYIPGQDTLCVLFWQSEEISKTAADANDVSNEYQPDVEEMPGYETASQSMYGIESQQEYMKQLSEACKEHKQVKVLQINTNETLPDLTNDTHLEEACPLVIAAESASGAEVFIGLEAERPFAVIVDSEGVVRYAGPAGSFMPAFILTEITGVQIDLLTETEDLGRAYDSPPGWPNGMNPGEITMMERRGPTAPPNEKKLQGYDPNKPAPAKEVGDPNVPGQEKSVSKSASEAKEHPNFPTQSLEDQIRAEKLLQSAQMHIEESRKLRMKNPKQGIEDARKVLQDFPNTEFADQARELLRRVPDRWKTRHNITDEELGY